MTDQKGFSLLEMILVVLIVGILAAIALPNLNDARKRAVETTAVGGIRSLLVAEAQFMIKQGNGTYGTLAQLIAAGQIDQTYVTGKNGYLYTAEQPRGLSTIDLKATPQVAGTHWFFSREDGRIYMNTVDDYSTAQPIPRF